MRMSCTRAVRKRKVRDGCLLSGGSFRNRPEAHQDNVVGNAGSGAADPAEMPDVSRGMANAGDGPEFFGSGSYVGANGNRGGVVGGGGACGVEPSAGAPDCMTRQIRR